MRNNSNQILSPEKKSGRKNVLPQVALGASYTVVGASAIIGGVEPINTAVASIAPESWQQFILNTHQFSHDTLQTIGENLDYFLVAIAGVALIVMSATHLKNRKRALSASELSQHPVWKKRIGESKDDYRNRVEFLSDMANIRLTNSLPGIDNSGFQAIVDKTSDKNSDLYKRLKKSGADSRFFNTIDSFDGDNSDAIKYGVMDPVGKKIREEEKKKWLLAKRVLLSILVGAIAASSILPSVESIVDRLKHHPTSSQKIERVQGQIPDLASTMGGIISQPAETTEAPETSPDVTEQALHNSDYEPGAIIGYLTLMINNKERKVLVKQGYASDGNPGDLENDPNSGYDHRLMRYATDGYSDAVHYNNTDTSHNGNKLRTPILPGNKGQTTFQAHNLSWIDGTEGGFNGLPQSADMGDAFTFTASNGTVFTYKIIEEFAIKRDGSSENVFNNTYDKDPDASILNLQTCYVPGEVEYDDNVHIIRGQLVSVTSLDGQIETIG